MRTGNMAQHCLHILRSVFQWRLLHAAALSTSRTGKRMQHCLQYCVQHVSVEVATRCIITSNEDWEHDFNIGCNVVRSVFQWRSQHAATLLRSVRIGNLVFSLLFNIEYSIFQWRWLHASSLHTTRTKNMVQHCPQYCSQFVSVDSLHAANIVCNIVCSVGGYTLQRLETWYPYSLLFSPPPPFPPTPTPRTFSSCFW